MKFLSYRRKLCGGESRIRTHGAYRRITRFQDWLHKPLGHLSIMEYKSGATASVTFSYGRLQKMYPLPGRGPTAYEEHGAGRRT